MPGLSSRARMATWRPDSPPGMIKSVNTKSMASPRSRISSAAGPSCFQHLVTDQLQPFDGELTHAVVVFHHQHRLAHLGFKVGGTLHGSGLGRGRRSAANKD